MSGIWIGRMSNDYFPTQAELELCMRWPDEHDCLRLLWQKRTRNGVVCSCGSDDGKFYPLYSRPVYAHTCGQQYSPTRGTIFEKSTLPLTTWYKAIYLITSSEGKIPALELKRQLGTTYKTAWRVKHLICQYLHIRKSFSYKYSSAPKPNPPH